MMARIRYSKTNFCSWHLVQSIFQSFHFFEVCLQMFDHQMLIHFLMLLWLCLTSDELMSHTEKPSQSIPKPKQRHKLQIEVFNLKHIITCNLSAQSLCSKKPKSIFVLASPFAKVFVCFGDGLTKVHNINSSKINKFPQNLNMILKSRHYFISGSFASVEFCM